MHALVGLLGGLLVVSMLAEFFVAFVLPRRVKRDPRIARRLFGLLWWPWRKAASLLSPAGGDTLLGFFGPLGLLIELALWTLGLVVGFACLQWATGSHLGPHVSFGDDLYFSAGGFLSASTNLAPHGSVARALFLGEAASGFAVLFIVIGYLPALYQSFSRREVAVSQLDARAGSPPSAGALIARSAARGSWRELDVYLAEWENWTAELMETQLAYPVLAYFRSQHLNQNWLAALTTVLDTAAFRIAAAVDEPAEKAKFTLAIGRHALSDFAYGLKARPRRPEVDRLDDESFARLLALVEESEIPLPDDAFVRERLDQLRAMYEPYAQALADRLALTLPSWLQADDASPLWKAPAWHKDRRVRTLP